MIRTLTLFPWQPATLNYGAGQTKAIADWGFADDIGGSFKSANVDELTLAIPGAALATSPFTYRSRVQIHCDGALFFTGYVSEDPRDYTGESNNYSLKLAGPWWHFENIVFMQTISYVTGVTALGAPILTAFTYNHITLNLAYVTTTPGGGVSYTPTVLNSQDQLKAILDFAILNGAYLQYDYASLMAVPVLPHDEMNILCAEAVRRQIEGVDAVAWFDHSFDPPKFFCQRRSTLAAVSRSVADTVQPNPAVNARGFKKLRQRFDLAVPYVRLDFEQTNTFNGQPGLTLVQDVYPPGITDNFKALIATVPVRGSSVTQTNKWLKTAAFDPNSLAFWRLRKPEMDPAAPAGANAAIEYADLSIIAGSAQRSSALPNMITEGGYCDWMGGNHAEDNISAQAAYERKSSANVPGMKTAQHTLRARVQVTDLNYPDGIWLKTTSVSPSSEDPGEFVGLAQVMFTDLSAPQWEGDLPLFENVYTGDLVLGRVFNLTGGLAAHATMNALAQEISFVSKSGGIFYSVSCGPNKKISPAQLADKLRASRLAYITVATFLSQQNGSPAVNLERETKQDNISAGEPQKTQDHLFDVNAGGGGGGILLQANAGSPILALQTYDAAGTVQTPASPTPAGQAIADYTKLKGSDGNWHKLELQEEKVCLASGKQRTRLFWCSETYQAPDDPA